MRSKESTVSKGQFDKSINTRAKMRKNDGFWFISRYKYKKLLERVKSLRRKKLGELDTKAIKLIEKFDVVVSEGEERLAVANVAKNLIYLPKEELYSVLTKAHLVDTDHGKLPDMMKCLKSKYKNVTSYAVTAYLKLCRDCSTKLKKNVKKCHSSEDKVDDECKENEGTRENKMEKSDCRRERVRKNSGTGVDSQPTRNVTSEMRKKTVRNVQMDPVSASTMPLTAGTRTPQRFEIIDMSACCNWEFSYLAILRESMTRFVHLKPLKSKSAEELANALTPIFACFGTPSALQTSDVNFVESTLKTMYSRSSDLSQDIAVCPPPKDTFPGEIESLMFSWVCHNSAPRWHTGLRFVQYIANLTYNKEIGKTPFEAMFGRKGKLGVSTLNLPSEFVIELRPDGDIVVEARTDDPLENGVRDLADVDISEMLEVVLIDDVQCQSSFDVAS